MRKLAIIMAAFAAFSVLIGCGGTAQIPVPDNTSPDDPSLNYPAYRATGPDGEDLYLQFQTEDGVVEGSFYFFAPYDAELGVTSGRITGSENEDGLALTLHDPFSNEPQPIMFLAAESSPEGLQVWDIEDPENVFLFEPVATPASSGTRSTGTIFLVDVYAGGTATRGRMTLTKIPIWLLPLTFPGIYDPQVFGSLMPRGSQAVFAHTWGNNWTWIDIHVEGQVRARLWVNHPTAATLHSGRNVLDPSSTFFYQDKWHTASGTLTEHTS